MKPNGFIIFDNTLWSYNVVKADKNDDNTKALKELNKLIHKDNRVDINMLNVADGITIVRKKGNANADDSKGS